MVSLHSPGCPETHPVEQAGPGLSCWHSRHAPPSAALLLQPSLLAQGCTTHSEPCPPPSVSNQANAPQTVHTPVSSWCVMLVESTVIMPSGTFSFVQPLPLSSPKKRYTVHISCHCPLLLCLCMLWLVHVNFLRYQVTIGLTSVTFQDTSVLQCVLVCESFVPFSWLSE